MFPTGFNEKYKCLKRTWNSPGFESHSHLLNSMPYLIFTMRGLILSIIVLFSCSFTKAQDSIFGKWKTIDDESNKPKSIVEIYMKNDKAYGKIVQLFIEPDEDPDPLCDECEGSKYNQRIIGMEIITGMEKSGDKWSGGEILDPENGNVYRSKIWVENEVLKVRGYIMFLYRTQTWIKEPTP